MGTPTRTDHENALKLVREVCGFEPGSFANFVGNLTGKLQSCEPKVGADLFVTMSQIWLLAGSQLPVTINLITRYKAHQAWVFLLFRNALFAPKSPGAAFDDFAKMYPFPTMAKSADDAVYHASRAAWYMEQASVAKGVATKLDRNFFQQLGDGFKATPELAKLVLGVITCVEAGKCNTIGDAFNELLAKVWKLKTGSADAALAAKATEIRSTAETQRMIAASTMASATADSAAVKFIKSPLGMVAIGGVALIAALVVSEALDS
jgi:hypothetical protein